MKLQYLNHWRKTTSTFIKYRKYLNNDGDKIIPLEEGKLQEEKKKENGRNYTLRSRDRMKLDL